MVVADCVGFIFMNDCFVLNSVRITAMHYNDVSDADLMERFARGNKQAFEFVYDRYWKELYHLAVRILEDEAKAEDLVQEVFVDLYEARGKNQIRTLGAYLYQAAKYKCFMQLRAGKISEKHLARMSKVIASNSVEEEYSAHELEEIIDKGISALPEKCRQVFYLSRFEELSNKAIATQLNISPKTVENQITKALKALKTTVNQSVVMLLLFLS
jgi:RNA polymerase sigma-70 factor (family 1)